MRKAYTIFAILLLASMLLASSATPTQAPEPAAPQAPAATEAPVAMEKIVIGWAPPDITGVFKTATNYFEQAAAEATKNGIPMEVITQSPATHTAFADQVAIIEDYIQRKVNAIAISPIEVEVVKPAIRKANEAGIPVIIVNLLEPIPDVNVASYIGFDNTDAGRISGYALLDWFGGPGVLGKGEKVDIKPGQYLDLAFWKDLYKNVDPKTADIKARVAHHRGHRRRLLLHRPPERFPRSGRPVQGHRDQSAHSAADWNREKGIKAAEDFLTANPAGKLDAIWAASNEMGLGAMLASQNAGRLAVAGTNQPNDGTRWRSLPMT